MVAAGGLGFWGRLGVISIGSAVVLISIVVVVCILAPGCWLHSLITDEGCDKRRRRKSGEDERLFGNEPPIIYYKTAETPVKHEHDSPIWPGTSALPSTPARHESDTSTSKTDSLQQTPGGRRLTPPFTSQQNGAENNSLLGALSTKRDSTYSSMSENSGRTSPTGSCRSSVEGSFCSGGISNIGSPTGGDSQGQVSFAVQFVLTNEERGTGKLIITIMEARGLRGRQYMGGACDPYVKVVIWKERRSLRKLKSPPLHSFRTRTVRHTSDPAFNESFVMEVNKSELKDLMVKITAMDCDKWVSPTTLGEVAQPLRDIKTLSTNPEKTNLNFFLAPAKLDFGEVLFGLSYLPTAQRLSVSVLKANRLKYSNVVEDIGDFYPYVRVLLISQSGRVIRKKKTTFRSSTDKPVWNETLIFDMPKNLVENVSFILAVCSRPQTPPNDEVTEAIVNAEIEESLLLAPSTTLKPGSSNSSPSHESYRKRDRYVGKVVLGCNVSGEEERKHWFAVLSAPRKVTSQTHSLK